jgi:hypothetical protein
VTNICAEFDRLALEKEMMEKFLEHFSLEEDEISVDAAPSTNRFSLDEKREVEHFGLASGLASGEGGSAVIGAGESGMSEPVCKEDWMEVMMDGLPAWVNIKTRQTMRENPLSKHPAVETIGADPAGAHVTPTPITGLKELFDSIYHEGGAYHHRFEDEIQGLAQEHAEQLRAGSSFFDALSVVEIFSSITSAAAPLVEMAQSDEPARSPEIKARDGTGAYDAGAAGMTENPAIDAYQANESAMHTLLQPFVELGSKQLQTLCELHSEDLKRWLSGSGSKSMEVDQLLHFIAPLSGGDDVLPNFGEMSLNEEDVRDHPAYPSTGSSSSSRRGPCFVPNPQECGQQASLQAPARLTIAFLRCANTSTSSSSRRLLVQHTSSSSPSPHLLLLTPPSPHLLLFTPVATLAGLRPTCLSSPSSQRLGNPHLKCQKSPLLPPLLRWELGRAAPRRL